MDNALKIDDYKAVIREIYRNRYFTNHGPQAQRLESVIEGYCEFSNVMTVGADVLALLITLKGVAGDRAALVPDVDHQTISDAVAMSGIECIVYDGALSCAQATVDRLRDSLSEEVAVVLLFEPEDHQYEASLLDAVAALGVDVIVYSESVFSTGRGNGFGQSLTLVCPLSKGLNASPMLDGGIIATNNEYLADVFRNIRGSYGVRRHVDVIATCNGRFSELQAGLALQQFERRFADSESPGGISQP